MIKFIICRGIGFSPGSVKYIPTAGFISGVVVGVANDDEWWYTHFVLGH